MNSAPLVTIVIPVFNDESTIAAALDSCLAQTMSEIEVICVDDASTDGTVEVIERFRVNDDRVRVIRHERNLSALQSRRTGVFAAEAPYILFLDGDDELVPDAAEKALATATATDADLVGFGVTVVDRHGRTGGTYEQRLRPVHRELAGTAVLRGLFPIGKPAQGQLWRYLIRTGLLRDAYATLPDNLSLPRINDLPIVFLVAALATRYVSIEDQLYRYHFGRGGSGHLVDSVERAVFYTAAIQSVESIRQAVSQLAASHVDPSLLMDSYESMRLSILGYVCFQLIERSESDVLEAALDHLLTQATMEDVLRACARFYPETLSTLRFHSSWQPLPERDVRNVLLVTSTLRLGGVSAVLASQAVYLREAGFDVTVVARAGGSDRAAVPDGVRFIELPGRDLAQRLKSWTDICRTHAIDVVIDHQVLYTPHWPEFALAARAEGAATIGWMHNFVGRPIYDGSSQLTLIERCSNTLAQLITLSPLDVAYFALRGVPNTAFVPNPPSPLLIESIAHPVSKKAPAGRIELIWWGRLENHTKRVLDLIDVGAELQRMGADFRITVVGPDWGELTAKKFNARAHRRGVGDRVVAVGPRRGPKLIEAIDAADAFVSTSVIEGYQLTIAEAQSRGLPVIMYELPWLTLVKDNEGILSVPQSDARALARQVVDLMADSARYQQLSRASLAAASRAGDYDFSKLYQQVVTGALPGEFSPEPTLEDASELLRLTVAFAERSHAPRKVRSMVATSGTVRLWESAAPLGRAALQRFPGIRPLVHRVKKTLGLG